MGKLTPVFFVESTNVRRVWFRRYRTRMTKSCVSGRGYCDARNPAPDYVGTGSVPDLSRDDARWPGRCEHCERPFDESDPKQTFTHRVYRAADGREWAIDELPPGAIYNADWYGKSMRGPDGRSLLVCLPPLGAKGSDLWAIDGPSSSGGGWKRTGRPEDGTLAVTPSILTPRYHGFLRSFDEGEAEKRGVSHGSYLEEC